MKKALIAILVIVAGWIGWSMLSGPEEHPRLRADETLISTPSGSLAGFVDRRGAHAWLGIPYAAAPVGTGRWRAPQPPVPWQGVREALNPGPICPQMASQLGDPSAPAGSVIGREDCLYLNVWAPADAEGAPVMLWLHGGGNSVGHGGSYSGDHLAVAEGVVVVTINYRLGPLGWFLHPALATGDPLDDSGNFGTLDVVRALHWTQNHIEAFGGDPGNVTVFGESAGAADTLAMMASPLARDLFHRAIVQSGGYNPVTPLEASAFHNAEVAQGHLFSSREVVNRLLVEDGSAPDATRARALQEDMPPEDLRAYLRARTPEQLLSVYQEFGFGMINFPALIADGRVLPEGDAAQVFSDSSRYNAVPVILGTNRDESALFMVQSPEHVETRFFIFPRLKDPAAYRKEVHYSSLAWKVRGVDDPARALHQAQPGAVYAYRFDWDEEPSMMGYDLSEALGAAHGLEIAFAFGEFEGGMGLGYLYPDDANRAALSRSMMGYWAAFAREGKPGRGNGSDPLWQPWGQDGMRMLVLDTPGDAGIAMSGEEVSMASIKTALAADTGVAREQRCTLFSQLFGGDAWDEAEYRGFGADGCAGIEPRFGFM